MLPLGDDEKVSGKDKNPCLESFIEDLRQLVTAAGHPSTKAAVPQLAKSNSGGLNCIALGTCTHILAEIQGGGLWLELQMPYVKNHSMPLPKILEFSFGNHLRSGGTMGYDASQQKILVRWYLDARQSQMPSAEAFFQELMAAFSCITNPSEPSR